MAIGSPVTFYRRQFELLWRWSGGPAPLARRAIATLVVGIIAFVAAAVLVPGIHVREPVAAIVAAITLATLTTLARPMLIGLLSGFSVALVGLGTFALQAIAFWLLANLPVGIQIDSLRSAILGTLAYAIVDTILAAGLSLADDRSFFGTLVRQLAARHRIPHSDRPGVLFVQIDGLSEPVLRQRLEAGGAPTIARWLRSGAMTLTGWEPLMPTQTSASQAGILHGNNDGIPGFRWWDKASRRLLVSNHPGDAREIMRRVSNGRGLLAGGGASIGNLLSGDATRSYLTAATIDDPARELRRSHVLDWFFISPYSYVRWLVLSAGEIVKELVQARRERASNVEPQGDRSFPYPLARAAANVLLRHLTTALVIEEMYRAAPIIYVDFVDYDEIAHHSGVDRVEARDAIDGIDRILALIEQASLDAPRPYRFVVLSDHGQTPGATFRARFGKTLDELIHELVGKDMSVSGATAHIEQWGRLGSLASEGAGMSYLGGRLARMSMPMRTRGPREGAVPDVVVAASGNLAHVSFPGIEGRATKESIDERHPGLIDHLVSHPGIGLVLVRTGLGTVALGRDGARSLADGSVQGSDPVARFGATALAGLERIDRMAECGDLVLISLFDERVGEVASFEGQIGSHGGLGGWQSRAFVLHPAEWRVDGAIVGATALHEHIRRWLGAVGA
jgi:uncharacterized membrane protein YvlD (DUF360 family)